MDLAERTLSRMAQQGKSPVYVGGVRFLLSEGQPLRDFFNNTVVASVDGRMWDEFRTWLDDKRAEEGLGSLSEATLHQYKNALRLVLKQAYVDGHIEEIPAFPDVMRQKRQDNRPRVHFSNSEYRKLLDAARRNIAAHRHRDSRWLSDAEELYDYIIFMANTGLLVSKSNTLRFKDVLVAPITLRSKGELSKSRCAKSRSRKASAAASARAKALLELQRPFSEL